MIKTHCVKLSNNVLLLLKYINTFRRNPYSINLFIFATVGPFFLKKLRLKKIKTHTYTVVLSVNFETDHEETLS